MRLTQLWCPGRIRSLRLDSWSCLSSSSVQGHQGLRPGIGGLPVRHSNIGHRALDRLVPKRLLNLEGVDIGPDEMGCQTVLEHVRVNFDSGPLAKGSDNAPKILPVEPRPLLRSKDKRRRIGASDLEPCG